MGPAQTPPGARATGPAKPENAGANSRPVRRSGSGFRSGLGSQDRGAASAENVADDAVETQHSNVRESGVDGFGTVSVPGGAHGVAAGLCFTSLNG